MKTGLVLGKFLPFHLGHIALIEFAKNHCDKLIVLICSTESERIPGETRMQWLQETFQSNTDVEIFHLRYDENILPNTSVSSKEVSKLWADYISKEFPNVSVFFSSEQYGEYMAGFLGIEYRIFDEARKLVPISGTAIMKDAFSNWKFIADAAKRWFVKKACIVGSESTGKSTLTENLAKYFETVFVPEMAREIIEKTDDVEYKNLLEIAALHAKTINEKLRQANKILICDTDVNITKSYSNYLFDTELVVPQWIEDANRFDLYIFLETDCPYIQDGTRIAEKERNTLSEFHKEQFRKAGIQLNIVSGNWKERFEKSVALIKETFGFAEYR